MINWMRIINRNFIYDCIINKSLSHDVTSGNHVTGGENKELFWILSQTFRKCIKIESRSDIFVFGHGFHYK